LENMGKRLKIIRIERDLSQEDVADKLHLSRQSISRWENGRGVPDIGSLLRLSELYETSVDGILQGDIYNKGKNLSAVPSKEKKTVIKDEGLSLLTILLTSVWIPIVGFFLPGYVICRNSKSNSLYKTVYLTAPLSWVLNIYNLLELLREIELI